MNLDDLIDEVELYVSQHLSPNRFAHSKHVAMLAKKLAIRFSVDKEKAYFAGIIHDIVRDFPEEDLVAMAEHNHRLEPLGREFPMVLHGRLASVFVKEKFNFYDDDIDNAVSLHTSASTDMNALSKIIFIADSYDVTRPYVNKEIRDKLETLSLDELFNMSVTQSVEFLHSVGKKVYPSTSEVYGKLKGSSHVENWKNNPLGCNQWGIKYEDKAMLIDASSDIDSNLEGFLQGVKELIIVITHGHFDHIAYASKIANHFINSNEITVTIKASEHEKMFYSDKGQDIFDQYVDRYMLRDSYNSLNVPTSLEFLKDGEMVGFKDFMVMEVPGHSPGCLVVYSLLDLVMFTGDLLFAGGDVGRTDLILGDDIAMEESLAKIFKINESYTIYPGHGPSAYLQDQKKYFPHFFTEN